MKDGRPTSEVGCFEAASRFLMPYRRQRAADFGPLALEAARNEMVLAGLVRTSINSQIGRIRRMFRWAVSKQLVRPDVLVSLSALPPLKVGRCKARESEPVRPVAIEDVEAVLPHLTPPLRAVVEVLLLTGARTGEILPFLWADPDAYVFRPTNASDRCYHKQAVRKAVFRVIETQNPKREQEGLPPIEDWHPHQLRHTAATRFRKEHGFEIARTVLGHAKVEMTELYAERDLSAARAVIAKIG